MWDFEDVKQTFAKKINKRPEEIINHWRDNMYGIIFTNGEAWKQQRKLFMETLKDTGFHKGQIEHSLSTIWPKIREMLHESSGRISPKSFDLLLTELMVQVFS